MGGKTISKIETKIKCDGNTHLFLWVFKYRRKMFKILNKYHGFLCLLAIGNLRAVKSGQVVKNLATKFYKILLKIAIVSSFFIWFTLQVLAVSFSWVCFSKWRVLLSVHVDGVEDPLCELLELGGRGLGLLLQALVFLPQTLDLTLHPQLLLPFLLQVLLEHLYHGFKFGNFSLQSDVALT